MNRRRWLAVACVAGIVAASALYVAYRGDDARSYVPSGKTASIRFRNALAKCSDVWVHVNLDGDQFAGQAVYGAVLKEGGRFTEFKATAQNDGTVVVEILPNFRPPPTRVTFPGTGGGEPQTTGPAVPKSLLNRAAELADALLRALNR
jgi:hypothetical protein